MTDRKIIIIITIPIATLYNYWKLWQTTKPDRISWRWCPL